MYDDFRNIRIHFSQLVELIIKKRYYFDLDVDDRTITIISKDHNTPVLGHVTFSDPPVRSDGMYVTPERLNELVGCLGMNPDDFLKFTIVLSDN